MRTLTLLQPWAFLAVRGIKIWETRSRNIGIGVGDLLIHSSQREEATGYEVYQEVLKMLGHRAYDAPTWEQLIRGAILGRVFVRSTGNIEPCDLSEMDQLLGDYREGRWFSKLEKPEEFSMPIRARGHQGIWHYHGALPEKPEGWS